MDNIESILTCLIANLDEGIHIVDNEGKTIYYNEAMGRMEGLKPQDVIGKKVLEYLNGVEEESSTLMNALSKKQIVSDVIQQYGSQLGKAITTINTTIPVCINGKAVAAVEISKNMTQLKELNEKICKLQDLDEVSEKHYSFSSIIGSNGNLKKAVEKAYRASLYSSKVLIY
jgi:arginine utilization regulatory protein